MLTEEIQGIHFDKGLGLGLDKRNLRNKIKDCMFGIRNVGFCNHEGVYNKNQTHIGDINKNQIGYEIVNNGVLTGMIIASKLYKAEYCGFLIKNQNNKELGNYFQCYNGNLYRLKPVGLINKEDQVIHTIRPFRFKRYVGNVVYKTK